MEFSIMYIWRYVFFQLLKCIEYCPCHSLHGSIARYFYLRCYYIIWLFHNLSILHSKSILILSNFWLLWIMPAQPFTYKLLCRRMFSILLGRYLGRTLVGHWVTPCFKFLREHQSVFHISCIILHPSQQYTSVPVSPHPYQWLLFCFF